MYFKRLAAGVLALSLTLAMAAGSATAAGISKPSTKLTIVHTNDVHSEIAVEPYAAELVKQKRAADENIIMLSAGDVLHGQPIATLSRGKNIVDIMNAAGYDAMVPGNHDFNYGYSRLAALQRSMEFPLLAANVSKVKSELGAFTPYIIKEFDGVRIGIFGLATPETQTKTNPDNVSALHFEIPYTASRKVVKELKAQGCHVIIALAHLGMDKETHYYNRSTALASIEGIDVVIDGHSHTELPEGKMLDGLLIAQTGSHGANIGMVDIEVKNGKVANKSATLLKTPTEDNPIKGLPPEPAVSALISKLKKKTEALTSEVVGRTPYDLDGEREHVRRQQTNLGSLINDAILAETGAEIAFTNGGNIRVSIKAGDITKGDILTVLPFNNHIVVKQVTGKTILEALELSVSAYPELSAGFLHVSGMEFAFDATKKAGERVAFAALKDGTPIDPKATYTLATNDFLADGGDGYEMLKGGNAVIYSALDEVVIKYIQQYPNRIPAGAGDRIRALRQDMDSMQIGHDNEQVK